jgi:hypothetical protein
MDINLPPQPNQQNTASDLPNPSKKRLRRNAIKPNSLESDQLREFAVCHQLTQIQIEIIESTSDTNMDENNKKKKRKFESEYSLVERELKLVDPDPENDSTENSASKLESDSLQLPQQ